MRKTVRHRDLKVYTKASATAMQIFEFSKSFPKEETFSLTDRIRRSSRSVCANLAEAWRKRRDEAAFISKICGSEGEAGETQTWIRFSVKCGYLEMETGREIFKEDREITSRLAAMIANPQKRVLPAGQKVKRTKRQALNRF